MSDIFGILNLGNTCYINVNIQMILNCKELNSRLLEKFDTVKNTELLYSYLCILKRLKEIKEEQKVEKENLENEEEKICIRKLRLTSFIEKFRRIFSQVSFNQQDCLEGLTFILDNFHNSLIQKGDDYSLIMNNVRYNNQIMNSCIKQFKNDIEKDHTLLFNLFYSYMSNSIRCDVCNHTIYKIEKYKELSVDLEKNHAFRNGWFHSGDYGKKDNEGNFYFHGRQDSLIIKGGENIYPAEIENVLYSHPDIEECAVIGIPHKLLGEDICAFIKIKNESQLTENGLKEFYKNKIADYKQPKKIIIINELDDLTEIPKGPTKKILYRKLKEYYKRKF